MSSEEKLIKKLSRIVSAGRILTDSEPLDEASWDALSSGRMHPLRRPYVAAPLCVIFQASAAEVREVVLVANEEKVPIVAMSWRLGPL